MGILLVASGNGITGMAAGMEVLRGGGAALDAVEAATRVVEADPADNSVGVGGYPNALGEVELDASIMDGVGRRAGAVASLRGFAHPISVARAVLERMPYHVLLTGDGAARWAREQGLAESELLTDEARAVWRAKLARTPAGALPGVESAIGTAPAQRGASLNDEERDLLALAATSERPTGTVNFIAIDQGGGMASAVSTSGWAFKYPGRVGDSPLIGAGNYCDARHGACACTGLGEWAIRAGTARSVVLGLQMGRSLAEAAEWALRDLRDAPLPGGLHPIMNFVAVDAAGRHGGWTTVPGRQYCWQTDAEREPVTAERTVAAGG